MKGRLLFDAGKYEEAVEAFSEGEATGRRRRRPCQPPVAELELYKGESLARLERTEDAEAAFRSEIEAFPARPARVPEPGDAVSVHQARRRSKRCSTICWRPCRRRRVTGWQRPPGPTPGNTQRANAIRADARVRFRGRPDAGASASHAVRADKRQPDARPEQIPHLPHHGKRHAAAPMPAPAPAPARPTTPRPRRRGTART